jgi:hypothetical protein
MSWAWQPLVPGAAQLLSTPPAPPATGSDIVDRGVIAGLMRGVMFGVGGYVYIEGATNDMIFIKTQTASASTSIDFVNGVSGVVLDSTYKAYIVVISNLVPATSATGLWLRTSTNAGSSYDSGASDYDGGGALFEIDGSIGTDYFGGENQAQILIAPTVSNTPSGESLCAVIKIYNPAGTTFLKAQWEAAFELNDNAAMAIGTGRRETAADVDAIRFLMSSGNITSGTFTLYGLANA